MPAETPAVLAPVGHHNRWILLALQLPARPSNARVKAWRRLQQLGAIAVKHAVYVLPHSAQAVEDFAWLRSEIESRGGQAAVFTANTIEDVDDAEIVRQFRDARAADYAALLADIRTLSPRRASKQRRATLLKEVRGLRERYEQIKARDFFAAPSGQKVSAALDTLETLTRPDVPSPARLDRAIVPLTEYRGRTWITRPRPGVDRFASAWLIRRFVDAKARFVFGETPARRPDAVPFDMYEGGFGHEGGLCTFEVIQRRFGIVDRAVQRIGEVVHDVDLKDERYRASQGPTLELLVEGLRASIANDDDLLEQGMALFEALYHAFSPPPARPPRRRSR